MAILRSREIRELSSEELEDKLTQLRNELMKARGVLASGGVPENVGRVREIKKTIARILTIKKAKEAENKNNKNQKSLKKGGKKPETK